MNVFLIAAVASIPCIAGIALLAMAVHCGRKQDSLLKACKNRELYVKPATPVVSVKPEPIPFVERHSAIRVAVLR